MSPAMKRELDRRLRKAVGVVSRAVVNMTSEETMGQEVQATARADETHDDVEHFQPFGFTSRVLAAGEAIFLAVGGDRAHGVVLAVQDRARRFRGEKGNGIAAGESAQYGADGQRVHCKSGGSIAVVPTLTGDVKVGADDAVLLAAVAEYVDDRLAQLVARIDGHTHPAGLLLDSNGLACTGATGIPVGSSPELASVACSKVRIK